MITWENIRDARAITRRLFPATEPFQLTLDETHWQIYASPDFDFCIEWQHQYGFMVREVLEYQPQVDAAPDVDYFDIESHATFADALKALCRHQFEVDMDIRFARLFHDKAAV